jgi:hypothetical protein
MGAPQLLIAKTAIDVVSTIAGADARNKQARYQADIARRQAEYQRRLAESEAATVRRQTNRALGKQAARFAAAGFDLGSGSALLAQQSLASEAEMEALKIRNGGLLRGMELDSSANLELSRARSKAQQDYLGLGTRLLANYGEWG